MDFLQISLIFLIIVITIFLGIGGWMVFLILKDLRKSFKKLNEILNTDQPEIEKIKQRVKSPASKIRLSPPHHFFKK